MKTAIQSLSTINLIDVARSAPDLTGGYTWTVTFLEDHSYLHRGDLPPFQYVSALSGGSGNLPKITISELRKGTWKEVQRIQISAGDTSVDPSSSFKLSFMGESTNDILALPLGGSTCLGSTAAKQIITTSTKDTIGIGWDNSVSPLTSFTITYEGHTTSRLMANTGSCTDVAKSIEIELEKLPHLYEISVSGTDSSNQDQGCIWIVTFESVLGNPNLLEGKCSDYMFNFTP